MELGTNIWRARKQLQLSQEQLGAIVGVTRQTMSNWELNETVPDAKQLLARIAVQLRKTEISEAASCLIYDDIRLDPKTHTTHVQDKVVSLTRTEYAILKLLMQRPDQVITKSLLLEQISEDTPDVQKAH